jgi:outer membrane immunogenic protein
MKTLLMRIAAAGLLMLPMGGVLADGPYTGPWPDTACYKWYRGFYVGSHVGLGSYTSHQDDLDGYLGGSAGFTASGWGAVAGPQIGYNFQSTNCRALFGFEGDWSGAGIDAVTRLDTNSPVVGFDQRIRSVLVSFGTLRTRAGFVVDNALLYLTGGLAIADVDTRITNTTGAVSERFLFNDTRLGWTAGAGTEWGVARNVTVKSEVLHLALGERTSTFTSPAAGTFYSVRTVDSVWIARVGLNIRLAD